MILQGTWFPTILPRKTLQAYRLTEQLDSRNRVLDPIKTPFTIENASVQPVSGGVQQTLPQGIRDKIVYKLFTTTPITTVVEGSETLADRVDYEGETYLLLGVKRFTSGVLNHNEAVMVKESDYELE